MEEYSGCSSHRWDVGIAGSLLAPNPAPGPYSSNGSSAGALTGPFYPANESSILLQMLETMGSSFMVCLFISIHQGSCPPIAKLRVSNGESSV
jgi:hypothetical protein